MFNSSNKPLDLDDLPPKEEWCFPAGSQMKERSCCVFALYACVYVCLCASAYMHLRGSPCHPSVNVLASHEGLTCVWASQITLTAIHACNQSPSPLCVCQRSSQRR